jgi:hypothetical protein
MKSGANIGKISEFIGFFNSFVDFLLQEMVGVLNFAVDLKLKILFTFKK